MNPGDGFQIKGEDGMLGDNYNTGYA